MNDESTSVNCRKLTHEDIETYIKQKPVENLSLFKRDSENETTMQMAIKELEQSELKDDFIKKIIIAPEKPGHTSVLIYGICKKKKFCFSVKNDSEYSFKKYFEKIIGKNKQINIDFLLSDLQCDGVNCGVFAVEFCKHLNLDDFKKILSDENKKKMKCKEFCNKKVFYVNKIALPASLQRYDQRIKSENIAELKQNPEKYNQFKKKIKKKNFVISNNSIRCKYLFKNLGEEDYIFDKIRPENLMNKAASYKRKKIVDLDDQKKNKNGIG